MLAASLVTACFPLVRHQHALRVLVFNIHAGKDAGGHDKVADLASLIRKSNADVVLLQEVDRGTNRSGKVDQVQALMDRTRYTAVFGQSLEYDGGQYGIAALSRRAFTFAQTAPLPVTPAQTRAGGSHEPRVALLTVAITALGSLQAVTTHLDASADQGYRLQEVLRLIDVIRPRLSSLTPVVAGGDFNAEPASEVIQKMRDAGFHDAWAECGQGDGFTYPSDHPVKRIDYVFFTTPVRCTSAQVLDTQISDHRPLLVTLAGIGTGL